MQFATPVSNDSGGGTIVRGQIDRFDNRTGTRAMADRTRRTSINKKNNDLVSQSSSMRKHLLHRTIDVKTYQKIVLPRNVGANGIDIYG